MSLVVRNTNTLAEIVQLAALVEASLIENDGELTEETDLLLQNIETSLVSKIDHYGFLIERFKDLQGYYKKKAEFFSLKSKSFQKLEDRLKTRMHDAMTELQRTELLGTDFKVKLQNSPPRLLIEEGEIDRAYTTIETITTVDKDRVKQDLLLGISVRGARLEQNQHVRILTNTKKVASNE